MNLADRATTSNADAWNQDHSIEYRVFYSVVFLPVFLAGCLCLLLPKHINPLYGTYGGRSPFAQARSAASGVVPYIFRM